MEKTGFLIRDYRPSDFPAVDAVWCQTGMGGAHRGDTPEIIKKTIDAGGKLLVLIESLTAKLVGTAWMTHDSRRIYLHHVGVLPSHQGRGLGKLLVEHSMEYAKKLGLQIKLEVHRSNAVAIAVYLKQGFKPLGEYDVYINRETGAS